MRKRKKGPTALEQAETLQAQLEALEGALNQIHTIQVVFWPSGAIFRASGTSPDTVVALTSTKVALQNVITTIDAQIVDIAIKNALAPPQEDESPACPLAGPPMG